MYPCALVPGQPEFPSIPLFSRGLQYDLCGVCSGKLTAAQLTNCGKRSPQFASQVSNQSPSRPSFLLPCSSPSSLLIPFLPTTCPLHSPLSVLPLPLFPLFHTHTLSVTHPPLSHSSYLRLSPSSLSHL